MVPLGRENVSLQGKELKLSEFPNHIVMYTHREKSTSLIKIYDTV